MAKKYDVIALGELLIDFTMNGHRCVKPMKTVRIR